MKGIGAAGEYRKQKLIAQFGADIALPDLRHAIAKCERHQKTGDACAVHYVALASREQAMADFKARFPAGGLGQLNTAKMLSFETNN